MNKKAFTLIELLAVIVILAIIALIATPITLNVINNARKKSFENTAYGLIDTAKLQYSENFLNGNIGDLIYTFPEAEGLKYSGEKPKGGTLRFTQEGNISIAIYNDEWCATKGTKEDQVSIIKYEEGKCLIPEEKDIPVITLLGDETMTLTGSSYTEPGYSIKTIGGETISNEQAEITILGQTSGLTEIDINTPDTYIITYAINYKGNISSATRTVIVEEKKLEEPTITPTSTPNSNNWYNSDISINIAINNDLNNIKEIKYCTTTEESCVPIISVDGANTTVIISTESATNYVCALGIDNTDKPSTTNCTGPYQLDKTAPDLTVPGSATITSSQVSGYNLLTGVSANDTLSDIDGNIITSGSLSTTEKTYAITYNVKDKAGNSTSKIRNITVKQTMADQLIGKSDTTSDPYGNLRYVGANPSNYVKFNNELWRIIGIFNGQVKIIRNEPYNSSIKWDTNNVNDWSQATLQTELNSTFLNSINTTSKSYIDTSHAWNLGGAPSTTSEWTRSKMYIYERGTISGRPRTWTGAIGLMYPSDYGYSTSSTNNICNTETMYNWNSRTNTATWNECAGNSWLRSGKTEWTITLISSNTNYAFYVHTTGYVYAPTVTSTGAARPVLYLKSNVKITGGEGTSSSPYTLGV